VQLMNKPSEGLKVVLSCSGRLIAMVLKSTFESGTAILPIALALLGDIRLASVSPVVAADIDGRSN